jgi:cytochrome d ubiquinol oxidase subunit I
MEALDLARWQFGITTVYHFFFVPMTIGLTWLVAVMQTKWTRTGDEAWLKLTKLFGKLFLINFAAGVVTGIVQEFQFGMNWSEYSRFVGDIFGAPLALEALIAFFMESTFVGLWIFGWDRLPKKVHLAMIYLTAIGTTISSIFILAANSWMQNPVGAVYRNGRAELDDFLSLITNPFFLTTFPHTIAASFIVAGGLVAGVAGWWVLKGGAAPAVEEAWRPAAKLGAWVVLVASVLAIASGHVMAQVEAKYQPAKLAASEGLMKTTTNAPLSILAIPDGEGGANSIVEIPGLLSWMAFGSTDAEVKGIDDIRAEYAATGYARSDGTANALQEGVADTVDKTIDPVPSWLVTYYAFRLMVGLGLVGVLFAVIMLVKLRGSGAPTGKLWTPLMVAVPLWPMLANIGGWVLAEIGRQPWIVYGVLPVQSAVSPTVSAAEIAITMILFTLVYAVVAVLVVKLFLNQIRAGLPEPVPETDESDAPLAFAY